MSPLRTVSLLTFLACGGLAAGATALSACDTADATMTVMDNAYPVPTDDAGLATQVVVYRGWWVTTYFPDAVAPGAESVQERTVPANDFAYAVLAPGWDPTSTTPPTTFVALKSKNTFSIARGDLLHITVSDATFAGNCAADQPLSQDDADFVTQRIFPGEFANVTYDAKTCTMTATSDADAGSEAGADAADAGDAADGD